MNSYLIAILVIIIIFAYYYYDSKNEMTNIRTEFITGMWSNDDEDLYIYIDKASKDGIHKGYIVKSTEVNEPIKVYIKNKNNNNATLLIDGTDAIKKTNNIKMDISDNSITIKDKNNKDIILKKD